MPENKVTSLYVGMSFSFTPDYAVFNPPRQGNSGQGVVIDRKIVGWEDEKEKYSYRIVVTGISTSIEIWIPEDLFPNIMGGKYS